jgi:crotonobetainyl-CoA:carnitine CoA-transferase CaiB-like acyl-CoA transferase
MAGKSLVPESFGPLQGVRVVSTGTLIAQPFAAAMCAEMGAEVIHVERPGAGDVGWRLLGVQLPARDGGPGVATNWIQERRNVLCVTLDLSKPRGRDLFLKIAAECDIWMESSKPGTYPRWGLDDETLWKANTRLVITHVSGFGQTGEPGYVRRTSYDVVGQAFSGMMYQTGYPDHPPSRAAPWTGDYMTAMFTLSASLAGLTYARAHGKGQSIDLAQFEAIHRVLGGTMLEYFHKGLVRERSGNKAQGFQPLDSFQTSDGWVVMGALAEVYNRLLRAIGLDPDDSPMAKREDRPRIDRGYRIRRDSARMDRRAHHRRGRAAAQRGASAVLADYDGEGRCRGSALQGPPGPRRMGRRAGRTRQGNRCRPEVLAHAGKDLAWLGPRRLRQ